MSPHPSRLRARPCRNVSLRSMLGQPAADRRPDCHLAQALFGAERKGNAINFTFSSAFIVQASLPWRCSQVGFWKKGQKPRHNIYCYDDRENVFSFIFMIFLFSPLLLVRLLFARIISDIFLLHSAAVSLSPMALGSSITVWRTVRRCQQINFSCRGTFFFFFVFGIFGEKGKERRLKILHVFSSLWHSFQFFINLFIAINARIHEWNKRSPKKCLSRSLKMRRGWRCEWRDALACVGVGDEIYRRFFE